MIPQIHKCVLSKFHLIVQKKPTHRSPLCCPISPLFFSSLQTSKDPTTCSTAEYLTIHHNFSPKTASKASSTIPLLKNPQKSDSVLSYLTESGFSKTHLEKLISKFPQILSANLKTIEPKFKVFLDSGFSPSDIADVVSNYPWALNQSADCRLGSTIAALKRITGSNDAVLRAMKGSSWIVQCDLEKNVIPNIEYLKSCGISLYQIRTYFCRSPRLFLLKPESLVEKVRRVREMGFNMKSRLLLEAIRVVSSMTPENWELKLDVFRRLGYSQDEILGVFRQTPQVFCASEGKIRGAIRVFVTEGGVDMPYLVQRSELLTLSLDRRVKPRLRVMEILRNNRLLRKSPQLSTMMMISHKSFMDKYVLPFSDALGDDILASWQPKEALTLKEH